MKSMNKLWKVSIVIGLLCASTSWVQAMEDDSEEKKTPVVNQVKLEENQLIPDIGMGTVLSGVTLDIYQFINAARTEADLKGAILKGATVQWENVKTKIPKEERRDFSVRRRLYTQYRDEIEFGNFSGLDFTGMHMKRVAFFNCNFENANFSKVDASYCAFVKCNMAGAIFHNGEFGGAAFAHSEMSGADLRECNLGGAILRGANLSNAALRGAFLYWTDFSEVNLTNADLSKPENWEDGTFCGNANFRGAIIKGANFTDAREVFVRETIGKEEAIGLRY